MKLLIIEDEAPAFRRLQQILEEISPEIKIIDVLDSVESAVKWLSNHAEPDLYLMDIQLSDGISFEIFEQVRISNPVIFTTAYDDYMLKAFRVNSIDYLLKPIKKEDLALSLKKYRNLQDHYRQGLEDLSEVLKHIKLTEQNYKDRFLVKQGDKMMAVETSEIAYFYTKHGVVHLVTFSGNTYLIDQPLDELQRLLDPKLFYRANRQCITNFNAISMVHRYHKGKLLLELKPSHKEDLVISAEKASDFKNWLDN